MKPAPTISASEIGEYVFCKRAWWLRQRERHTESEKMREGTRGHERLVAALERIGWLTVVAWTLLAAGMLLFLGLIALFVLKGVQVLV